MCIVRWYNTTALCTWPALVHYPRYNVVVNPCRPIRAPVLWSLNTRWTQLPIAVAFLIMNIVAVTEKPKKA